MIYQFEIFKNLSFTEKKTFGLHLSYSIIEGVILGVIALNEFVFVKSLNGSDGLLSVLFSFSVIVLLFSIFFNEFLKRYSNKRKLLILTGLVTRLPLLALIFFPTDIQTLTGNQLYHFIFLGIFLIYFLAQPIVLPIINLFLKNNYEHENFGKLYSYSTMLNKVVMLVTTFATGRILDYDNFAFRYIYPVIGILGITSIILLALIRVKVNSQKIRNKMHTSVVLSIKESVQILKKNKAYRDFEIGFMMYGFAFMTSAVMITLFYKEALDLNYSSVAFYKNFYNILAISFLPLFGKLMGNIDPRKFAIMTFAFLFLTILFTAMTEYFQVSSEAWGISFFYVLMIANVFYGLFAGAMPLLWNIGSAYFCSKEESATYQAIHLSLTGLRGCFAPFLAVLIYSWSNFTMIFALGMLSLLIGILVMYRSMRKHAD